MRRWAAGRALWSAALCSTGVMCMNDNPTLARFFYDWVKTDETSKDGLPIYRNVLKIQYDIPPLTSLCELADDAAIQSYPKPYELFQKEQAARKPSSEEGYPLAYWPVPDPAEFKMLADRDIHTVQQLAKLVSKKNELPPSLFELAERAKAMVELHKEVGKYEAIINQLTGEIATLSEQVRENRITISSLEAQLDALKARVAA
jgi:hypothetical protein